VKRAVGGHWSLVPKLSKMAVAGEIEAYNLPLGTLTQLFRDIAGHRAGTLTKVGLRTFVDPRQQGGRINRRTTDDLVRVMTIDGEEWLFYRAFPVSVALLRGTTADVAGNITMEREALTLDNLALAMAAKNSNGFVIAQVERVCAAGALNPRQVQIPGVLVDCVVVARPEHHHQTYATVYSPAYSGEIKVALDAHAPMPLDERKVIARRCAFELPMGGVVNLGIGMPEGVAQVANEEKVLRYVTLTAEPGVIGGFPQGGLDFGAAVNTDAVIHQNQQFDFYDGGGLDMACLGLAQVDADGNVNVSRFGSRLAGAGGFINISQSARRILFAGTFTTGGLKVKLDGGRLVIAREGKSCKFIKAVEQITFNGAYAAEIGQPVLYVTERCVFERTPEGMALTEVAPGVDIERDILAHMDFVPIVGAPREMDPRIFRDERMQLEDTLLGLGLAERISYDAARNTIFLNLEGMHVKTRDDCRPYTPRGRGPLPQDRQESGARRQLRQFRHRSRRRRHVRGDDPLHGNALLHKGFALYDERIPAPQARRGARPAARRAAHLRNRSRSARLRRPASRCRRLIRRLRRSSRRFASPAIPSTGR
jgi:propionate CoA-transferase